jgi:hypothetical protein
MDKLSEMHLKLLHMQNELTSMKKEVWQTDESPLYCKKYDNSLESIYELVEDAANRVKYVQWHIDQLNQEKAATKKTLYKG